MARIVHCPGCNVLLVEPPPGIPIYQCGQCSKILYAKHAIRPEPQVQKQAIAKLKELHSNSQSATSGAANKFAESPLYKKRESPILRTPQDHGSVLKDNSKPLYNSRSSKVNQKPEDLLMQVARDAFHSSGTSSSSSSFRKQDSDSSRWQFQGSLSSSKDEELADGDFHRTSGNRWKSLSEESHQEVTMNGASHALRPQNNSTSTGTPRWMSQQQDEQDFSFDSADMYGSRYEEYEQQSEYFSRIEDALKNQGRITEFPKPKCIEDELQQQVKQAAAPSQREVSVTDLLVRKEAVEIISEQSSIEKTKAKTRKTATRVYPSLEFPYVSCQNCKQLLEVPKNLPPFKSTIQKLRCAVCQKISKFTVPQPVTSLPASGENSSKSSQLLDSSAGFEFQLFSHATEITVPSVTSSPFNKDGATQSYFGASSNQTSSQSGFPPKPHKFRDSPDDRTVRSLSSSDESTSALGSAPASFHHLNHLSHVSSSKGYDSAPEFHLLKQTAGEIVSASAPAPARLHNHSNGRGDSELPMAPCLHELFGYDSPTQFFTLTEKQEREKSNAESKGMKLKGLIKKRFQDINSKIHHHAAVHHDRVIINGMVMNNEAVKKASEKAGVIHPGSYWYDVRAGFWGMMGGPCIGIIPPLIEEMNFPMPRNCAGGKTGIFVNGRELHHKDLEKLAVRGFPLMPGKCYTLDVDGRLINLDTETEIRGLGALAPTVLRKGVGDGMYPLVTRA